MGCKLGWMMMMMIGWSGGVTIWYVVVGSGGGKHLG